MWIIDLCWVQILQSFLLLLTFSKKLIKQSGNNRKWINDKLLINDNSNNNVNEDKVKLKNEKVMKIEIKAWTLS